MSGMESIYALNSHGDNISRISQPLYVQKPTSPVAEVESDKLDVSDAVKNINKALNMLKRETRQLNVDEDVSMLVVKIVDAETNELVRQIPHEDAIDLSKRMREIMGLLYWN
jgi:flagellar protein FlaG